MPKLGAAIALVAAAIWLLWPSETSGPRLGAGEAGSAEQHAKPVLGAPPPSVEAPPPPVVAAPAAVIALSDENALMAELRAVKDRDPRRAEELARAGNARYPNSADAPERASILIHALAAQGRSSDARGEAEDMVNRYPISQWVLEIEAFTGAHRHGDVHVTDAGQLVMD